MLLGFRIVRIEFHIPVLTYADPVTRGYRQDVTRLKFMHTVNDAVFGGRSHCAEQTVHGSPIKLPLDLGQLENNFQLRTERKASIRNRIEQRLDSQPVAGDQQAFAALVPYCERKHSPHLVHARLAVLFVKMDDNLCIGVGVKAVSLTFKRRAQGLEVVNLAVEDDPHATVFVVYRLVAPIDINDAQPPHAEYGFRRDVVTRIIRTTMHHRIAHCFDFFLRYRLTGQAQHTSDSTHITPSVMRYSQATCQPNSYGF